MKNINKYLLASTLALGTMLTACEDEVLVPVEDNAAANELSTQIDALQTELFEYNLERKTVTLRNEQLENKLDSLNNSGFFDYWGNVTYSPSTKVQYTVNVLSSANHYAARAAGVGGASVTVSQGGNVVTKETNSGLAVFDGLIPGRVNVTITAPDHTSVEMTVWLYNSTFTKEAEAYNVSTQVALYPVAGENMATIKGNFYANTTTLNDTLSRRYGTGAAFGDKAGTNISNPGPWDDWNWTQGFTMDNEKELNTVYNDFPSRTEIAFEAVPANFELLAIARPQGLNFVTNDPSSGQITQITYNNMVFPVTITDGNKYSVNVPSSTKGGLSIEFQTPEVIAEHTRMTRKTRESVGFDTDNDGTIDTYRTYDVVGGSNEAGSAEKTFKYFNNTNSDVTVYTLAADDADKLVTIAPNKSADVVRRTITEKWYYEIHNGENWGSVSASALIPKQVNLQNLYVWPMSEYRQGSM